MLHSSTKDFLFSLTQHSDSTHFLAYKELLKRLGSPQEHCKCIHIAGTNGKGSVAAFLTSILRVADYNVGLYTSPDLFTVRERIRLNGALIPAIDFENHITTIRILIDAMLQEGFGLPTYFEVLTALAFLYFYESKCDLVVLETGLGGRCDATNVISHPLCTVITTISYDHVPRLGTTLEEITYEKAGIIKFNAPVVSMPHASNVETLIYQTCNKKSAPLVLCDYSKLVSISNTLEGQVFDYKHYKALSIKLLGEHQIHNAALAIDTIEVLREGGLTVSNHALYQGLKDTAWPGRLEIINEFPLFLIDGAHNVEAAKALKEALLHYFPHKKIIYLFGTLKDKDYAQILEITMPLADEVILTLPPSSRAMPTHELEELVKPYCSQIKTSSSLEEAVSLAYTAAYQDPDHTVVVAFGSLYFIGQLPSLLPPKEVF